jgi:hypothetical protein
MEQWESLVWLLTHLSLLRCRIAFAPHDANAAWSQDPNKECPGKYVNMNLLHDHVRFEIYKKGSDALKELVLKEKFDGSEG